MTSGLGIFFVSFVFSFLGSIPPGSINLSILSLSLDGKKAAAVRFALAAALVEYPYAYIALKFEAIITENAWINEHFHLLSASVMIALGIIGLLQNRRSTELFDKFRDSGFRKGIVISILNPLAIPFWIGVTAYLKNQGWVVIDHEASIHYYVMGVSLGTFVLLISLSKIATGIGFRYKDSSLLKIIPAIVFLILGIYSLMKFLLEIYK